MKYIFIYLYFIFFWTTIFAKSVGLDELHVLFICHTAAVLRISSVMWSFYYMAN